MSSRLKDIIFDFIVYTVVILTVISCMVPFLHVISLSLSSNTAVMTQKVSIIPVDFNFESYIRVYTDKSMSKSLLITTLITVLYTVIGMVLTICCAYPLTKMRLKGRKLVTVFIVFTMYFNGGIIPNYLLVNRLHMLNTIWCLVLPLALSPFNMIILKTYFSTSIPNSLEESAKLDGCSEFGILMKIILPLSMPILATLSLFYAVFRWNGFQDALFYITNQRLYPIQLKVYQIISASSSIENIGQEVDGSGTRIVPEVLKSTCIMFATIPILLIYPWLQKYFVTGVMVGAVKG